MSNLCSNGSFVIIRHTVFSYINLDDNNFMLHAFATAWVTDDYSLCANHSSNG
jgi:hypothetical protein